MRKEVKPLENATYISPDIMVVQIETEQNILAGGSGTPDNMGGEDW